MEFKLDIFLGQLRQKFYVGLRLVESDGDRDIEIMFGTSGESD